jgi:ribose transport system ATP-binding protein
MIQHAIEAIDKMSAQKTEENNRIVVQMKSVTKWFPGVKALDDVDFSVSAGQIHALVGENGAGKSTLIKVLGGVFAPDKGRIFMGDREVFLRVPHSAQAAGICVVHQELILVPFMSVAENILLGQEQVNTLGLVRTGRMKQDALKFLEILNAHIECDARVADLTASQQKLVQIAKALASNPQILVLDEPTAPLGIQEAADFFRALQVMKERGTALVYVSHRLEEVFQIADQVTVLKDGKVVADKMVAHTSQDELIRLMIGRELGEMFPTKSEVKGSRTILSVRGLKREGELFDIDLDLQQGEILGIAGLKGQGQDVLLKALFGAVQRDGGTISHAGREVRIKSPSEAIRTGMALVTDKRADEGLCMLLNVRHNLALSTLKKRQKLGVILPGEERTITARMVDHLNVQTASLKKLVKYLSGGNQQKVIVGKWLISEPHIMMFIEPTLGIDVGAKTELYRLIRELADTHSMGVLMVSSDMLELLGLCNRILVMYGGKIVSEIQGDVATEEMIMKAALGKVSGEG